MNKDINLLIQKQSEEKVARRRKVDFLRLFAIGFLLLVSLSSMTIFFLIQASPLPRLKDEENTVKQSLSQQQTKFANIVFIDQQLQDIDKLLKTRLAYDAVLDKIIVILPNSVTIDTFFADQKTMALTLLSPSLSDIGSVLDGVSAFVKNKQIAREAKITAFTIDKDTNSYKVTLSMALL